MGQGRIVFKGMIAWSVLLTLVAFGAPNSHSIAYLPQMWVGSNGDWTDQEVMASLQTVVELIINKQEDASRLKISFSGGRLSFWPDVDGRVPQALFSILVDGAVIAEKLDFNSGTTFRNKYPIMSTVVEGLAAGEHTISVAVSKTDISGEGGVLTYTTTIGHEPNTYKAHCIVEEWPPPGECCAGDFDHDVDVDGDDLAVFASDFGRTDCP